MRDAGEWWVAATVDAPSSQDAVNLAVSAVSTISTVAAFVMATLGLLVALFALVGWAVIAKGARNKAAEIAENHSRNYISSPEFAKLLEQLVATEVAARARSSQVSASADPDDTDPFPEADLREEDDR